MHKALLTVLLAMAACTALASDAMISVTHAWIRLLPGNLPLAGYFDLRNTSGHMLVLVGAESTQFARIELHRSMEMQGMDHMIPVKDVEVAAGARMEFAPGGYHLMLFGPRHSLKVGERVTIVFRFAHGQSQAASFVMRPAVAQ